MFVKHVKTYLSIMTAVFTAVIIFSIRACNKPKIEDDYQHKIDSLETTIAKIDSNNLDLYIIVNKDEEKLNAIDSQYETIYNCIRSNSIDSLYDFFTGYIKNNK